VQVSRIIGTTVQVQATQTHASFYCEDRNKIRISKLWISTNTR